MECYNLIYDFSNLNITDLKDSKSHFIDKDAKPSNLSNIPNDILYDWYDEKFKSFIEQ